jgi:hypothetical protein
LKDVKISEGVTCHYDRIDSKWYVVWGADFPGDDPGKKLVPDNEALLLEMGYQVAKFEDKHGYTTN